MSEQNYEIATLGGGCFWCLEAAFALVPGVISVVSGYSGGTMPNPTYESVCEGNTGHAEVVRVTYDPLQVGFQHLLEVFFAIHDPTTLNRQGHDVGSQYRSVIFYHSLVQKEIAESAIARINAERVWGSSVVTEVVAASAFFPAEDYHQHYFEVNPDQAYCRVVIAPKVEKLRKNFPRLFGFSG